METRHTPAPWVARIEGGKMHVFGRTADGLDSLFIAKIIAPQNGFNVIDNYEEVGKANARLIAAAPELLEALRPFEKLAVAILENDSPALKHVAYAFNSAEITITDLKKVLEVIKKATI